MNKFKMTAGASLVALALIGGHEGLRTKAYFDPVRIPTICYGSTKGVKMGDVKTVAECQDLLREDMQVAYQTVMACTKVPLNDNQAAAFTSFAFNTGPGRQGVKDGYCTLKSGNTPSFLRKLNAGDYTGACKGLLDWGSARQPDGTIVQLKGLYSRRVDESNLCLKVPA